MAQTMMMIMMMMIVLISQIPLRRQKPHSNLKREDLYKELSIFKENCLKGIKRTVKNTLQGPRAGYPKVSHFDIFFELF